jgi:hypothetical protein
MATMEPATKELEPEPKTAAVDDAEIGHGHLDELEVDLAAVVADDSEFTYESNRSPFPEGWWLCYEKSTFFFYLLLLLL